MKGEGVAKKEMVRRTGLSVPTVRKYLFRRYSVGQRAVGRYEFVIVKG